MQTLAILFLPVAIIAAVVLVIVQWSLSDGDSGADHIAQVGNDAANRAKGFHCLSSWDGSHTGIVREVKAGLRDPDSFEHVDTLITPVQPETGLHGLTMTFRARNGFGGMNLGTAIGEVDPVTCIASNVLVDG
tara:strand:+ start:4749 stop:5147 length:399 start_codon:yes stop_codon:yes gene_type:complete